MANIRFKCIVALVFFLFFFSFQKVLANIIGEFREENEIIIETQNYIDAYINWNFREINATHWLANFTFNSTFLQDAKSVHSKPCSHKDWTTFQQKYFPEYDVNKVCNDIENITNYLYQELTKNIKIQKIVIDFSNGFASFYIIFPQGFRKDEKAKFGFGSTIINTATTVPFYPNQRAICRDGKNYIHIVWRYDSTTIKYARSTDNGNSWQITTWSNETANALNYPHISCDGNNITVVYSNISLVMKISEDNGVSWNTKLPRTSGVDIPLVERRGQRIYVIYKDTDSEPDINFFNSTDAGLSWSSDFILFDGKYVGEPIYMSDNFYYPSLAVDGTGSDSDKLYVAVRRVTIDYANGYTYFYIEFKNSSNSGVNWSSVQTVVSTGTQDVSYPSITFKNDNVYVSYFNSSSIV